MKRRKREKDKFRGKLAVGMYLDGDQIQVVCLRKKGKRIKLVDAAILSPHKEVQPQPVEEILDEEGGLPVLEDHPELNFNPAELGATDLNFGDSGDQTNELPVLLLSALNRYPKKKYHICLTLPEPNIYYAYFHTDWDLKGKKLKQKVIEELGKERPNAKNLKPDAIQLFKLADGRLMAIVRDNDLPLYTLFETIKSNYVHRAPRIRFTETAELSLVNLINAHYDFEIEEVTAVIHIGIDSSRLLFMQGNEIFHISYIIASGLQSENIATTVQSRLMLEYDNLQLKNLKRVILTGEAFESGIYDLLREKLPEEISVEYARFDKFDTFGIDPLLSRFAIAGGAALRALDSPKKNQQYQADLTPTDILDGQKSIKLGFIGWLLLALLPVLTLFFFYKIHDQQEQFKTIDGKLQLYKQDLYHLKEIEKKLAEEQNQLNEYNQSLGVLDSILVDVNRWSNFNLKLARLVERIGKMWITEIAPHKNDELMIRGYSIYRNRIPRLTHQLKHADLLKVEVQEIRQKKVYFFEIKYQMPREQNR
ncbi:MAG: hypothetical protein D6748_16145 [Calditrichaeota bacterium]|nr:MAG: hypothetical protein D6748_16145 [Calditrichota bacterium]